MNNAIQDADLLVEAIAETVRGEKDLKSAIEAYGQSTYARGKTDIDLSVKQMYSYHHWDALMDGPLMKGGYNKATK